MLNFAGFCSRALYKGRLHKIIKTWPLLVQKNVSTGSIPSPSPLSVWTHYSINFEKFDVFYNKKYGCPHLNKPLSEKCRHRATPWLRTFFYGQPLTSYQLILNLKVLIQHCSRRVVHMFEISTKIACIFCRPDPYSGPSADYIQHNNC